MLACSLASSAAAQYFGKNKVRYDTFDWQEYPTPHFRISFYDRVEPTLPKLASFAESATTSSRASSTSRSPSRSR